MLDFRTYRVSSFISEFTSNHRVGIWRVPVRQGISGQRTNDSVLGGRLYMIYKSKWKKKHVYIWNTIRQSRMITSSWAYNDWCDDDPAVIIRTCSVMNARWNALLSRGSCFIIRLMTSSTSRISSSMKHRCLQYPRLICEMSSRRKMGCSDEKQKWDQH